MNEIPNCPKIEGCYCYKDGRYPCECGITEKFLRSIIANEQSLTQEQREWCLNEIDSVEGYERKHYESGPDELIANGVLSAWVDYCRDKGLM